MLVSMSKKWIGRIWINCPSIFQPYHNLNGKRGIICPQKGDEGDFVTVFFTEGPIHSMRMNRLYLEQAD